MKHILLTLFLFVNVLLVFSQTTADYLVPLTATTSLVPPQVTVQWPYSDSATSYKVYRKTKEATSWGIILATLTPSDTFYVDNNVSVDSAYEYKVEKAAYNRVLAGYIYSAVRLPAVHDKGILLLLVDSLFADSLPVQIERLMKDISGDGWQVKQMVMGRNELVPSVKAKILNVVAEDSARTKAVLLLGHIPVPYSGDINPDGHSNHRGAWPADAYYGDINSSWTDISVNDTTSSYALNKNIPGDGKFDQSNLPSNLELEISRVDFYNMPSIPRSEVQLMKNYLDKDHAYRHKLFEPVHRGLVDDNFGVFSGEAFASCGYRNFAPLLGRENIFNRDFISTLDTASYQWAYGCGGGSFNSAGGIGSTTNFATKSVNAVFTMLFGSYFGDWNSQNNFLRAPLCADEPALTCCWAGRPYWFFHHMAMGEHIGFSARLSQNNPYLYSGNFGVRSVHVALMGDLTLKQDVVAPVTQLTATPHASAPLGASLNWTASVDTVLGYYVYKSTTAFSRYEQISGLLTSNTFYDSVGTDGLYYYMVRAAKLQSSPSGMYINLSEGITDSATVTYPFITEATHLDDNLEVTLFPNPASDLFSLKVNESLQGSTFTLYDCVGKEIQSIYLTAQETICHLPSSGLYFWQLQKDDQLIKTGKIISAQ
ncbi:MAG: T9SS type A sorting domain-containing protein [Bacteroidetes bacterium]|nr:T9SS type A sorting domain-containing protein [Bacteroidota bacterium]